MRTKRVVIILILSILTTGLLSAQTVPLRQIDFSGARISLAGPDSFYVRNVRFEDEGYAVTVSRDESGAWSVMELYAEAENLTPESLILDFATVSLEGERTLLIDGLFVDGAVYQGRLRIGEDESAELVDGFTPGSMDALNPERIRELREAILEIAAVEYEERIDRLEAEIAEGIEAIARQEEVIEELTESNSALTGELRERDAEIAELQGRLETVSQELEGARQAASGGADGEAVEDLTLDIGRIERELRALRQEADGIAELIRELQEENERLVRENEQLRTALDSPREEPREEPTEDPRVELVPSVPSPPEPSAELATARELLDALTARMSRSLLEGFSSGEARMGQWSVSDATAEQNDRGEYFSRFALPLEQMSRPTLFRFTARSLEREDWTGFGLHLFASSVERPMGYGHGESLLIWFTRDPESYGSDNTFLQIYRSSDDVAMGRVAGGVIPEVITDEMAIEVLYQPESGDITVAVDGEVKLLYNGWFGIDEGVEIALRTKGRGRFEDLAVLTEP